MECHKNVLKPLKKTKWGMRRMKLRLPVSLSVRVAAPGVRTVRSAPSNEAVGGGRFVED